MLRWNNLVVKIYGVWGGLTVRWLWLFLLVCSCATQRFVREDGRWVPISKMKGSAVTVSVEEAEEPSHISDFKRHFMSNLRPVGGGLYKKFYRIQHADVRSIQTIIKMNKSPKGRVVVYAPTNTVVITDTKEGLARIAEAFEQLDVPPPQVRIKVRVVELSSSGLLEYGFGYTQDRTGKRGAIKQLVGTLHPKSYLDSLKPGAHEFQGSTFVLKMTGKKAGNIDLIVRAFRELGNVKIHACPDILVAQGKIAKIHSGQEVPYTTISVSGTTVNYGVRFKPVGVTLDVTPELVDYEGVRLRLRAEISSVTGWTDPSQVGGISNPIISKRTAETTIHARDGRVLIIGGLISERTILARRYIPLLGDIPVLGYLFSQTRYETERSILNFILQVEIVTPFKRELPTQRK